MANKPVQSNVNMKRLTVYVPVQQFEEAIAHFVWHALMHLSTTFCNPSVCRSFSFHASSAPDVPDKKFTQAMSLHEDKENMLKGRTKSNLSLQVGSNFAPPPIFNVKTLKLGSSR